MILGVLLLLSCIWSSSGYTMRRMKQATHRNGVKSNVLLKYSVNDAIMQSYSFTECILKKVDVAEARAEFWFFFFAGSGALGIGIAQIPKILKIYEEISSLAGSASLGGDDAPTNPIATIGFPEKLKTNDILQIINEAPSSEVISNLCEKKSYLASLGYLEQQAFYKSLPNSNSLAKYAIFEAMTAGGGSLIAPSKYDESLKKWRSEGVESFCNDLFAAASKRFAAYGALLFLILLVFDLIIESGVNAFL